MEVILLDKIDKLGELGSVCDVKPGYARNYLFPQSKALPATPESKKKYAEMREGLEKRLQEKQEILAREAAKARELSLIFTRRASEEGRLYGSVGVNDILHELTDKSITIEKRQINMVHGAIRDLGDHTVELRFDADNVVELPVNIKALTN